MNYGQRQDEHGQFYELLTVNTDGGRQAGQLVRRNIYNPQPTSYIHQAFHQWRIFTARGREAEVLTTCSLRTADNPGIRCKICAHLPIPSEVSNEPN